MDGNYSLFIDDERDPVTSDWIVVRSSADAISTVKELGMPTEISFDHDLGGDDKSMKFIHFLVDEFIDKRLSFPEGFTYFVHSQNPVGAANIKGLMDSLIRYSKSNLV